MKVYKYTVMLITAINTSKYINNFKNKGSVFSYRVDLCVSYSFYDFPTKRYVAGPFKKCEIFCLSETN